MQILAMFLSLLLSPALSSHASHAAHAQQPTPAGRQLFAARGEIVKIKAQGKGVVLLTIRPVKEFAEVSITARENDLVGSAVGREDDTDLIGLLAGEPRDEEVITVAELGEGDVVSVIYDPQAQNRLIEIYRH